MENDLLIIKNTIQKLKQRIPQEVIGPEITIDSKIPFKAKILFVSIIARNVELLNSIILTYESNFYVVATILTRCFLESTSILYRLSLNIKKSVLNNSIDGFDEFIMKSIFGLKTGPTKVIPTNIMTFVDKVNQEYEGFKDKYHILSEYAHPNSFGVFQAYGKIDKLRASYKIENSNNKVPIEKILSILEFTIIIFEKSILDFEDHFQNFVKICTGKI